MTHWRQKTVIFMIVMTVTKDFIVRFGQIVVLSMYQIFLVLGSTSSVSL